MGDYVLLAQLIYLLRPGWIVRGYVVVEVQSFRLWATLLNVEWLAGPAWATLLQCYWFLQQVYRLYLLMWILRPAVRS